MKEKDSKKKDDKIDNDYIFSKDNINIIFIMSIKYISIKITLFLLNLIIIIY